ncbi:11269_t:CDS:2, partial [Funneliformis geosporum]
MIDLSYFVVSFVFGLIGWVTYILYISPYYISPLRKLPGPPSDNLLFGNFQSFITKGSGEPQLGWIKKYGNFVKFHGIFNQPNILVTDTKIIQEITLNQVYDYPKQQMLFGDGKAIFGEGLIIAEGDTHKRQRKMMNPAFTHNHIKNMIPTFIHAASKLTGLIEGEVNEGETKVVLTHYLTNATLDIIGLVGFNHEFNSLTSPSELAEAYELLFSVSPSISSIFISIVAGYIPFIRKIPIEINKRFNKSKEVIDRESIKLMKEKYNDDKNN